MKIIVFLKLNLYYDYFVGFSDAPSGKESAWQRRRCKRQGFDPWVGKIPWRRAWQPAPVFLPGESHGQRSRGGYSPQGHKELDGTEVTQHACMTVWSGPKANYMVKNSECYSWKDKGSPIQSELLISQMTVKRSSELLSAILGAGVLTARFWFSTNSCCSDATFRI